MHPNLALGHPCPKPDQRTAAIVDATIGMPCPCYYPLVLARSILTVLGVIPYFGERNADTISIEADDTQAAAIGISDAIAAWNAAEQPLIWRGQNIELEARHLLWYLSTHRGNLLVTDVTEDTPF